MGFLFDRKGRNETDGRREGVAKKSASLLAAVAVAGGSAVVGLPQAEAAIADKYIYFEKMDPSGKPVENTKWELSIKNKLSSLDIAEDRNTNYLVVDNLDYWDPRFDEDDEWYRADQRLADLDPRPGHFLIEKPLPLTDERGLNSKEPMVFEIEEESDEEETGYGSCVPGGRSGGEIEFTIDANPYHTEFDQTEGKYRHTLKETAWVSIDDVDEDNVLFKPEVSDKRFDYGSGIRFQQRPDLSVPEDDRYIGHLPKEVLGDTENWYDAVEFLYPEWVYTLGTIYNCRIEDEDEPSEEPTPTPSTVTETVTETPKPSTTTVTPPTTTVTLPSTVTTTVTPPATTVTETPKTETMTATTTESATTTVTETPTTETVTETPQRETVTLTPEKETETVTETPQKETVTETPKTETVTHTPDKETVTETPKASTETSTVTAPQVTVTETPKQVTETTTLPQKTVTEQVPTTVVENKTETVKVPPVTVTKTEKQEPTTVTATPEKVTETVKVPGEKTTVVETKPGEPTTVRETVTETPDVPAVVEQPTPNAPVVDTPNTPVIPGAFSGTVVWDEDRSKHVNDGDERIPCLTVVAYKDGKEIARTTTDENGFYKFDGLEPGEYGIAVYGPDGGELFFDDKAATVVAGEEDTGNDWGFVREDAPAPVEEGKPATPVETVRMTLATTGANSYALAGLGAVLAALVALAVVSRRKTASQ
ncbi:SdrD B-like domain-containing protein [Corynebacterium glaucum]|mgnify:CR=1 FL=1|uniref:SdrD B-like domain-containing protein n=1 Tax=Corynebacterium glaucum TaxID=187491 RepID=UPI00265ADF85|nr:SdrD B-like domain-containing protein [Corynebacterium glaucum]